jgi:hypothetical protein
MRLGRDYVALTAQLELAPAKPPAARPQPSRFAADLANVE